MMHLPPDIEIRLVEFETRSKSLMAFTLDSTAAIIILCRITLAVSFIKTTPVNNRTPQATSLDQQGGADTPQNRSSQTQHSQFWH
jgi:hypothetical protein